MTHKINSTQISPAEISILPLIPLIICAKAEGGISEAEGELIINVAYDLELDTNSRKLLITLLHEDGIKARYAVYLSVLKDLLDNNSIILKKINVETIIEWSARVCAVTQELPGGPVSENEAAALHMIIKTFGNSDPEKVKKRLELLINEKIPDITRENIRTRVSLLFIADEGVIHHECEEVNLDQFKPFGWLADRMPTDIPIPPLPDTVSFDKKNFLKLLAGSLALEKDEKIQVIETLPNLTQTKIFDLIKIFEEERIQFNNLDLMNFSQLYKLQLKYLVWWMEIIEEYRSRLHESDKDSMLFLFSLNKV